MKLAYCINQENPHAHSLAVKLCKHGKPGMIIFATPEEMEVLLDRTQFVPVELSDEEEIK